MARIAVAAAGPAVPSVSTNTTRHDGRHFLRLSDSRQFELLLDDGPEITPRAATTGKGSVARLLYKTRGHIEQTIGKLKRLKRISIRCENREELRSVIAFACGLILLNSVHTVYGQRRLLPTCANQII